MLSSGILDFAIGLVFTFLAVSLAAGAATETVASVLKWRSHTLLQGIKSLLNDPNATALAGELYKHGLINPRSDGSKAANWRTNPAYIDADQFAVAFLDIIKKLPDPPAGQKQAAQQPGGQQPALEQAPEAVRRLKAQIAKVPGDQSGQLKTMLNGIVERAVGDEEAIRAELSKWFDNAMDRVSGAYKRWAQLWSFLLALIMAATLNISTIDVAQSLWKQPVDTKAIAPIAAGKDQPKLTDVLKELDTLKVDALPIGWPITVKNGDVKTDIATLWCFFFGASPLDWTRIAGWLITAFATLFGAPFWFDALQTIIRLKGSGPSPQEKKDGSGAAA
jgi:hypothetical protein